MRIMKKPPTWILYRIIYCSLGVSFFLISSLLFSLLGPKNIVGLLLLVVAKIYLRVFIFEFIYFFVYGLSMAICILRCKGFWTILYWALISGFDEWKGGTGWLKVWDMQQLLWSEYRRGEEIMKQIKTHVPEISGRASTFVKNLEIDTARGLLIGKLINRRSRLKQKMGEREEILSDLKSLAKGYHCVGPINRAVQRYDMDLAKKIIAKYSELLRLAQNLNIESTIIPLLKNESTEAASKLIQRTQETNAHRKIKTEWTTHIKSLSGEHQGRLFSLLDEIGKHQTGSRQFRMALYPLQASVQKIRSSSGKRR